MSHVHARRFSLTEVGLQGQQGRGEEAVRRSQNGAGPTSTLRGSNAADQSSYIDSNDFLDRLVRVGVHLQAP